MQGEPKDEGQSPKEEEDNMFRDLPKFGGFVAPPRPERPPFEFPNPLASNESLKLMPGDVQFTDVDGDIITIRAVGGNRVDMYVGDTLRFEKGRLLRNGNTLEITAKVKKGTPLSFIGFNLEEIVTEGTTPQDVFDLERALALVGS
jgi:hypothetical protein